MVSCLALIGRSPTSCTRLPTYTHSPYHGPASDSHSAWRSKDADPRLFLARSLRNILHDIIHSSRKGRYCQSVRRTVQTIWRLLSSIGYFTFTVFWCSYLFTALTMAVRNQVESSSSLTRTILHDVTIPKIPHFIYQLSTRFFAAFFRAVNK